MDTNQARRLTRALEVLNEKRASGAQDKDELIGNLSDRAGKLDYWLRDIIALVGELDGAPPPPADPASCGHPRNADGECSCSSWPERAPTPPAAAPVPGWQSSETGERLLSPVDPEPRTEHPGATLTPLEREARAWRESLAAARRERAAAPTRARYVSPGACFGPDCEHRTHQWSAAPALAGYGYTLPEDYLRGGAQ